MKFKIESKPSPLDHQHISLICEVHFNIPLISSASVGNGSNAWLQEYDKSGSGMMFETKKGI